MPLSRQQQQNDRYSHAWIQWIVTQSLRIPDQVLRARSIFEQCTTGCSACQRLLAWLSFSAVQLGGVSAHHLYKNMLSHFIIDFPAFPTFDVLVCKLLIMFITWTFLARDSSNRADVVMSWPIKRWAEFLRSRCTYHMYTVHVERYTAR